MPNVGTITGSMVLDPSAYISGLGQAAAATRTYQAGINGVSFAGFNRGIFATTTLLYGLNRIMHSMSKGMEEYSNMLGRIGSVADMTAASVGALADSIKQLSIAQGVSRKDIMGGMYTAAQSGFSSPAEMRAMATSGAILSRASGKEINVNKSVDLISVARQALGIGMDAVSSGRMNNLLLRGRDVGRWELDQMAAALGIPLTVYGNQFAGKIGGEETLRQLVAIMSTATLAGMNPRMTATGTRRLVERTVQLNRTSAGDPLRRGLRDLGFGEQDPIGQALNQGPIAYLNTLMRLTGGQTSELNRLGFGSRDLMLLTSAMRGRGGRLNSIYEELSYANTAGVTERYAQKMKGTYDYTRDQLRSQWEITSQQFMQASIPLIEKFVNVLGSLNRVAQSMPESAKSFTLLLGAMTAFRYSLNLLGFRGPLFKISKVGAASMATGGFSLAPLMGNAGGGNGSSFGQSAAATSAAEDRLARRLGRANSRNVQYSASFGAPSGRWVPNEGQPWGTSFQPFRPMAWNQIPLLDRQASGGYGPRWYNAARREPMNFYQAENMRATSAKWDRIRALNNRKFWAPSGNLWITPSRGGPTLTLERQAQLANMAALGRMYLPNDSATGMAPSGRELQPGYRATPWGPSVEARIAWAAYKRGQSVDFASGQYGSLSAAGRAYAAQVAGREHVLGTRSQGQINRLMRMTAGSRDRLYASLTSGFGVFNEYGGKRLSDGSWSQPFIPRGFSRHDGTSPTAYGSRFGVQPEMLGRAVAGVTSPLKSLGVAVTNAVGPMLLLTGAAAAASRLLNGLMYQGSGGKGNAFEGRERMKYGAGGGPSIFDAIGHRLDQTGSFMRAGKMYQSELVDDYARRYGYVRARAGEPGFTYPGSRLGSALWSIPLLGPAAKITERAWRHYRGEPIGLEGFRQGGILDALGLAGQEYMSKTDVNSARERGIDFGNFGTVRGLLDSYMRGTGNEPPTDWDRWIKTTPGGLDTAAQYIADALKSAGDKIEEAGQDAANATKSIGESLLAGIRPVLGYVSGYSTLFGLEGTQREPYQIPKGAMWDAKYGTAAQEFSKKFMAPFRKIGGGVMSPETLASMRTSYDELVGKSGDSPFKETQQLDRKLQTMQFLAKWGPYLSDKQKVPDELLASGLNLDTASMNPAMRRSVFDSIRNLDYTGWTKTFEPQKTPFSSALYYGTKEGYNATLERPKEDFTVKLLTDKLGSVADSIDAMVSKNDERERAFKDSLVDIIKTGTQPIVDAVSGISSDFTGTEGFPSISE